MAKKEEKEAPVVAPEQEEAPVEEAQADTPEQEVSEDQAVEEPTPKGTRYFKNTVHAGERLHLGFENPHDPTTEKLVAFVPYAFRVRGDDVLEGYLATSDAKVIKRLQASTHAEEIDEKEYKKAIKDGRRVG